MRSERRPVTSGDPLRLHTGYALSSFSEHLREHAPDLLPGNGFARVADAAPAGAASQDIAPHGTTIVAVSYRGGVLIAGDRRATQGNLLASRDMEKVYITDSLSAAGIAGTAGVAVEMIRLFAVELEHYEKIEGIPLTFDGKANKLSKMVRDNLPAALQGLAVVPILVGYDLEATDPDRAGRIVSFDVVGGRSEERFGYTAVGSGSMFAKTSLKKTYHRDIDEDRALRIAVEALADASDDDTATGGPDMLRGIYPTAVVINAEGSVEVSDDRLGDIARLIIDEGAVEEGSAKR
ncbi:proteasome subunit beta [Nocardia terpenica]|uniref:proteasome subunit beta n=1 Tax=Nocardia terpenica TaxID=455432 RepID=UPI001893C9BE|nr:proteasome subunit beta [Nocardia terpenica]MBF6061025.1 proteasome subunit beta [Nocardia terpenica]MBF6108763.1 proteasome subunit beta [Nocardia terpenica]MBF6114051.1 proteasome subunit beta [Nocardia terpenica]MBF6120325.1 proteasome subunit beta [Nocardia terpenica]MBF6156364.1 proteasome subunit beta [Nocardia terpenica]